MVSRWVLGASAVAPAPPGCPFRCARAARSLRRPPATASARDAPPGRRVAVSYGAARRAGRQANGCRARRAGAQKRTVPRRAVSDSYANASEGRCCRSMPPCSFNAVCPRDVDGATAIPNKRRAPCISPKFEEARIVKELDQRLLRCDWTAGERGLDFVRGHVAADLLAVRDIHGG